MAARSPADGSTPVDRGLSVRQIARVPPVARVGDRTSCPNAGHVGGVIVEGSPNVSANDRPVARVGDKIACGCGTTDTITTGASKVRANDRPVARVGSRTAHGGTVVTGSPNVFAGDGGPGSPQARAFWAAARAHDAFAPRCPARAADASAVGAHPGGANPGSANADAASSESAAPGPAPAEPTSTEPAEAA